MMKYGGIDSENAEYGCLHSSRRSPNSKRSKFACAASSRGGWSGLRQRDDAGLPPNRSSKILAAVPPLVHVA